MTAEVFYPYAILGPDLKCAVVESPKGAIPRASDGALLFHKSEEEKLVLDVSLVLPKDFEAAVFPPEEHGAARFSALLILRSVESRYRNATILEGDGVVFAGRVELGRNDFRGEVEAEAVVVRDDSRTSQLDGFAAFRGSVLARSEKVRLLFDEPRQPPGNFLEVEWVDFTTKEGWLMNHQQDLFAIEWSSGSPKILLNSSFRSASTVLNYDGTRGLQAAIRDETYYRIVHQVWSSIVAHVFERIRGDGGSAEGEVGGREALAGLEDWERAVVEDWAEYLFPNETSREEALERLIDSVHRGQPGEIILRRLPNAIQSRLGTNRGFERLVAEGLRS